MTDAGAAGAAGAAETHLLRRRRNLQRAERPKRDLLPPVLLGLLLGAFSTSVGEFFFGVLFPSFLLFTCVRVGPAARTPVVDYCVCLSART